MLVINTSTPSLRAQKNLNERARALNVSFERLSSGLRVNGADDDAAGLAISTRMEAQVKGLHRAIQNANDWISLFQTAEGGLQEMTNILQRVRELSVQSLNGTLNDADRGSLNQEVSQLVSEMDRIAERTTFNGVQVLDGGLLQKHMQLGANAEDGERVNFSTVRSDQLGVAIYKGPNAVSTTVGFNDLALIIGGQTYSVADSVASDDLLSSTRNANSAIAKVAALQRTSSQHGVKFEVAEARFETSGSVNAATLDEDTYLEINNVKISGFEVLENDADGALRDAINAASKETGVIAEMTSDNKLELIAGDGRNIELTLSGFGGAFMGEADNSTQVQGGRLKVISKEPLKLVNNPVGAVSNDIALGGDRLTEFVPVITDQSTTVSRYNVSTAEDAHHTLTVIEFAFEELNAMRSQIGAYQNRLESTIANLQTTHENLSVSRSRITDADFASESAALARNQIIQQAGVSVLAQANLSGSVVLSLL